MGVVFSSCSRGDEGNCIINTPKTKGVPIACMFCVKFNEWLVEEDEKRKKSTMARVNDGVRQL